MEDDDGRNPGQRKGQKEPEVPDLEKTMQAMTLAEPGLCRIQENQVTEEKELDFSCCLMMKVACSGGSTRTLSQQSLKQALSRAWKEKFHAVSQVSASVFLAHFKSQEDLVSVYIKQPWVANSENLLVEWFDPNVHATSSSDFKFDTILVTVRAYGIPRNKRSINLLKNILNQVGEVSDFHILQENNLFAKQDYIWGKAKLKTNVPVKDKVAVSFQDSSSTIAYLHYEKIKRICLFCGIMFHNAQDCNVRNRLVSQRQKNRQSAADILTQRYGQWIVDDSLIPINAIQIARMGDQSMSGSGNEILQRLRNLFEEDPKGKGKMTEDIGNVQPANILANVVEHHIGTTNQIVLPMEKGQSNEQHHGIRDIALQQHQGKGEQNKSRNAQMENSSRSTSAKRSAPASELIGQPQAKKFTTVTMRPSLLQSSVIATPSYNPKQSLAHNAELLDASLSKNLEQPGILGAAPTCAGSKKPIFSCIEAAGRQKPSRWDMEVQGITHYTPGAATWRRHKPAADGRSIPVGMNAINPASPCRSDATSAMANTYEHDPWPIHTPVGSFSQGAQDSRLGTFSPPPMARDYYVTPTAANQIYTRNVQDADIQGIDAQQQAEGKGENQNSEAEAPALKAPRAP